MDKDILKQVKVLYVEDDVNIREALSRGLKRRVGELEVAVDGIDGFDKYNTFKPDIIVTDIKMPNMSGLEMSKRIREFDAFTPIIITSAHGESETLIEAIEIGVNGYVLKPIDKDKLFNTIITYAKSRILEKQIKLKDKQLQQQSKNAALGELIGNIAHQWRQPLSIISTSASAIQMSYQLGTIDTKKMIKLSNTIMNTTQTLSRTIDYFSNIFISKNDKKMKFNISNIISEVLIYMDSQIRENDISIVSNIFTEVDVENYQNLFRESLIKIIQNSIDVFEDQNTEHRYIFLDLIQNKGDIIVSIKDSGGGIDENIIDNIFEPYFTTKHQSSGKGLGLYSVFMMVKDGLGGNIEVSNEHFEYNGEHYKGAVFRITLMQ